MKAKHLERGARAIWPRRASPRSSSRSSAPSWIVGVVGQLQLDVLQTRLEAEYDLPIGFEAAPYVTARWCDADDAKRARALRAGQAREPRQGPRRQPGLPRPQQLGPGPGAGGLPEGPLHGDPRASLSGGGPTAPCPAAAGRTGRRRTGTRRSAVPAARRWRPRRGRPARSARCCRSPRRPSRAAKASASTPTATGRVASEEAEHQPPAIAVGERPGAARRDGLVADRRRREDQLQAHRDVDAGDHQRRAPEAGRGRALDCRRASPIRAARRSRTAPAAAARRPGTPASP